MIEAYSLNVEVGADSAISFNSTTIEKGCTVTHPSADTFNLNRCGVYMVSVDASAGENVTIQLYKNGVAQPQAQSTGGSPCFVTLVQSDRNNSCCACASPTVLQVQNVGDSATLTNCNICITKIC